MSTILKALRRLEKDRGAQSQRPLREEVTRGSAPAPARLGGWPLRAALLGLAVAVGVGALAFRYLGGAPEPAEPTELAAAGSAEPRAEPSEAAKRARGAKRARPRPAPARAPRAASERELPEAALASGVEVVKRPPAQPRIAAPKPAGPPDSARARSGSPRRMDPAEIPGRHKPPASRLRSGGSPSITARPEAPAVPTGAPAPGGAETPATSRVWTATPALPEREPRAEQPREAASEPVVVAETAEPERAAPEPPAGSGAAREPELGEPAPADIARAEIPGLRVERTVWHPIAERRLALIEFSESAERREIREGDAVGPLVVSKIEPSGVVFVHEGVEVRRRIGE